jgi:hypothetical protein
MSLGLRANYFVGERQNCAGYVQKMNKPLEGVSSLVMAYNLMYRNLPTEVRNGPAPGGDEEDEVTQKKIAEFTCIGKDCGKPVWHEGVMCLVCRGKERSKRGKHLNKKTKNEKAWCMWEMWPHNGDFSG